MDEQSNIVPRDRTNGGLAESAPNALSPAPNPFTTLEIIPREPHLYDYLLILRKHQWLIASFVLAVVTIVTIATYREQPIYEATTRIEIDKENTNILPAQAQAFSLDG